MDNKPYGKTYEAIDDMAFDTFSYIHTVLGSMDDLNAASLQDVQEFFKRYYAPNNATLAICGFVIERPVVVRGAFSVPPFCVIKAMCSPSPHSPNLRTSCVRTGGQTRCDRPFRRAKPRSIPPRSNRLGPYDLPTGSVFNPLFSSTRLNGMVTSLGAPNNRAANAWPRKHASAFFIFASLTLSRQFTGRQR